MKHKLNEEEQRITVYKINPNLQELNGEVNFDRNVDGRNLHGNLFILDNTLIVEDDNSLIIGIFSLDHYYFLYNK